jgi:hypothetical protein
MPEIVADSPDSTCYHLFSGIKIQPSQSLAPDLFSRACARSRPFRPGRHQSPQAPEIVRQKL